MQVAVQTNTAVDVVTALMWIAIGLQLAFVVTYLCSSRTGHAPLPPARLLA